REPHARDEALHLDVEDLAAPLLARRRIRRHVGKALVATRQLERVAARQREVDLDRAKRGDGIGERVGALSEARLARALLHEAIEIDVRRDELRSVLET